MRLAVLIDIPCDSNSLADGVGSWVQSFIGGQPPVPSPLSSGERVCSPLKNRNMDAPPVRFKLFFARTRRPSYVFQQAVRVRGLRDRGHRIGDKIA